MKISRPATWFESQSPLGNDQEGQTVVELETDKAVIEVPSTVSGVIEEVTVAPSQRVKTGDVLFTYTPAERRRSPRKQLAPKACRGY